MGLDLNYPFLHEVRDECSCSAVQRALLEPGLVLTHLNGTSTLGLAQTEVEQSLAELEATEAAVGALQLQLESATDRAEAGPAPD